MSFSFSFVVMSLSSGDCFLSLSKDLMSEGLVVTSAGVDGMLINEEC
jgi:hypothetical protein